MIFFFFFFFVVFLIPDVGLFFFLCTAQDLRESTGRLLLLTYYASHGVWEESREQTREPNGLFVQRHALTRSTIGRSSILVLPA